MFNTGRFVKFEKKNLNKIGRLVENFQFKNDGMDRFRING